MRDLISQGVWERQSTLSPVGKLSAILRWYSSSKLCLRAFKLVAKKLRFLPQQEIQIDSISASESAREAIVALYDVRKPQWRRQWSSEKDADFHIGKLTLLNKREDLGDRFDWASISNENSTHLWRFQLQYHEFLLRAFAFSVASGSSSSVLIERMKGWSSEYAGKKINWDNDAWHPYCLSRRIPVWCQLLFVLDLEADERTFVVDQVQRFAKYLHRSLEWDIGGNHLLENLRGLAYAGCLFVEAKWGTDLLEFVFKTLKRQTELQILPSGEHFEKSPMYHCQVLWIYLEIALLCRDAHPELSNHCRSVSERIHRFLERICHPDGEIALFGDSVFEECPDVASIRRLMNVVAENSWRTPVKPAVSNETIVDDGDIDYFVFGNDKNRTIVDCGDVAAAGLPAHGHCDQGTFETSLDGERVITDTGIIDYSGSIEQRFCKSSVSHNVTMLDGRNTCDIWGKFRMGFRGSIANCRIGKIANQPSSTFVSFQHDSYRRLSCISLNRLIGQFDADNIFCFDYCDVQTEIESKVNRNSLLHFHPRIQLNQVDEFQFVFSTSRREWKLSFFDVDAIEIMHGIYCPEFGKKVPRQSTVFSQVGRSRPFGWIIGRPDNDDWAVRSNGAETEISNDETKFVHNWKEQLCI